MAWTYEQLFNGLNTAALSGQDSWDKTGSELVANVVETGTPYEGAKHVALSGDTGGSDRVFRDLPSTIESGEFYISVKGTSNGTGYCIIELVNSAGTTGPYLGLYNGNVAYGGSLTTLQAFSAGTYYRIGIRFECGAGGFEGLSADQAAINVNGGSWTTFNFNNALASISRLRINTYCPSSQTWYFDTISPNYATTVAPTVTTQDASSITKNSATGNGNITATGGEDCDKRGIVYGLTTESAPGNVAPGSSGYDGYEESTGTYSTGAFTESLTSLLPDTTYYARAYAHNSAGYAYGDEVTFDTLNDLMENLTDDFNNDSLDTAKWSNWGGAEVVEDNSQLEITTTVGGSYEGIISQKRFILTSSSVSAKVVNAGNQSYTSLEVYPVYCKLDDNNVVFFRIDNNTVRACKLVSSSFTSLATVAYSLAIKFFRIREASGTTYWDYSENGTDWTNLTSAENPIAVVNLQFQLMVGTWQEEAGTTTVIFDDVNVIHVSSIDSVYRIKTTPTADEIGSAYLVRSETTPVEVASAYKVQSKKTPIEKTASYKISRTVTTEVTEDSFTASTGSTGTYYKYAQVFQASKGGKLKRVIFRILKQAGSSPTGNMYAKLYAITGTPGTNAVPTGSALATSEAVLESSVTESQVNREFTFSVGQQYQLVEGTWYAISFEKTSSSISLRRYSPGTYHAGNSCSYSAGAWTGYTTYDLYFYVYSILTKQIDSAYKIQSKPSAIEKTASYAINTETTPIEVPLSYKITRKVSPTEVASSYKIRSETTPIEKSSAYRVPSTIEPIEVGSAYSIQATVTPIEIGSAYGVQTTIEASEIGSAYMIRSEATPIEKSSEYVVSAGVSYTDQVDSAYAVQSAIEPTETESEYKIQAETTPQEVASAYRIKYAETVEISSAYGVQHSESSEKTGDYLIQGPVNITIGSVYRVMAGAEWQTKTAGYGVSAKISEAVSSVYRVASKHASTISAGYEIANIIRVASRYAIFSSFGTTVGSSYVIRHNPYSKKTSPYSRKESPFSKKASPYSRIP